MPEVICEQISQDDIIWLDWNLNRRTSKLDKELHCKWESFYLVTLLECIQFFLVREKDKTKCNLIQNKNVLNHWEE